MRSIRLLCLTISFGLLTLPLHAGDLSTMDAATRSQTGIEKLSAQERAALQHWIDAEATQEAYRSRKVDDAELAEAGQVKADSIALNTQAMSNSAPAAPVAPAPMPPPVAPPIAEEPRYEAFDAEVSESFKGLRGRNTRIELTNGQIWQQVENDQFSGTLRTRAVRLKPKALGSWIMQFKHNNQSVRVKRVQ
jgi:hypothetical protein